MKSFWEGKRVFITGGAGFVGSHLVKRLVGEGAEVIALIRTNETFNEKSNLVIINGELENFNLLKRVINEKEIEYIFHLGAQTIVGAALRDPFQTFESNIRGTYNLLEAARLNKSFLKGIVIASSDKAYGISDVLPYKEDFPLFGKSPYDVSKSCTDLLATSYFYSYNLPISIARCGNIFGGGDLHWNRIVPGTIKSFYYGLSLSIRSDGSNLRDYIYVEDVVNAYLLLGENIEKTAGEAFNFGPNNPLSVLDLVDIIKRVMKANKIDVKILNTAKSEIHNQYLDWQKACKILKWAPGFSIEQGLGKTIQWYEEYFNR